MGDTYWGGKGKSGMKDAKLQAQRTNSLNKAHHNAVGGKGITRPQDGKHSTIKPKRFDDATAQISNCASR